ncbi:hypothetical protein J7T55_000874 [Diaporthe amygdali]|uniref:uncharacterized protein n=1 Tax=Phomopsis amygdali TaxID=1214568 RepID=UPI0022FDCDD1|nr:uncharacterized protein J7T55_000874 [Diaporthe amygdali]KAJ0120021.1 hypothetical protein J7T55_000874 [Diaporthe amygdali]
MEHRDEMPRRRRMKRRNETRERDITRIETDKSAARRRRIRRGDDEKKVEDEAVESSGDESDDEDKAKSTSGSSSTIASSTAPPPGRTTLSPSPLPPPIAPPPSVTVTPPPAEASTSAAVPLSTTTSATLESQTLPPASTTLDTQTIISAAPTVETQTLESSTVSTTSQSSINTPIAAGETTDPPRAQNGAGLSRQSTGVPPAATAAIAVFGSLAGVGLLAFLFWKLYRRRRGRDEPDQSFGQESFGSGPKSDIRIMDEAIAAAYKAEGGNSTMAPSTRYSGFIPPRDDPSRYGTADQGVSRWSDSTPGWFRRQVQKVKSTTSPGAAGAAAGDDSSPKDAAVSRWMDRHASRMLDPMAARASVASSGAASLRGLGPVPSVSPASVVGDQRESILSEMGQIRRAAVPPPLDPKLVQRVKQMQEEKRMREQEQTRGPTGGGVEEGALRPPPPIADRRGDSSPTAMSQAQTETTWNTWGVEQHRK